LKTDPQRAQEIEREVLAVLHRVGEERGIAAGDFAKPRNLVDIGFKSVDLSRIVALLEMRLGEDPFITTPITDIRSVGDLMAAYVGAAAPTQPAPRAAPVRRDAGGARRRRAARQVSAEG
jgi:hypothetical protein